MPAGETASRMTPYIEQLLEDESARENLRRGADKLREAYERSQKKRVTAADDKKLRRQLKSAAQLIGDGATTLMDGAQKPKRRRRRLLKLLTVAAVGAGVALALSDDLRSAVLGSGSPAEPGDGGSPS
jgi:hypothetical protein